MKLTVLGNNGSFPGKDSACSGYLLSDEGKNIRYAIKTKRNAYVYEGVQSHS